MGTFTIYPSITVSSRSGIWSGGPNGTWVNRNDSDLVAGINQQTIANTLLSVGKLTGTDPTAVGAWLARFGFALNVSCISVDGAPAVSFAGLPSGFTPLSATLKIGSRGSIVTAGSSLKLQLDSSRESAALSFIAGNSATAYQLAYDFSIFPNPSILDIISNGFGLAPTFTGASNFASFYNFRIDGTYEIQLNPEVQPSIEDSTTSIIVGDKVKIASAIGGLTGVEQVQLTYTDQGVNHEIDLIIDDEEPQLIIDGVIYWWIDFIILQDFYQFWFYLPFGFRRFKGPVLVTLVGNGTQFSGSVTAGVLEVIFADTSGIYSLVEHQGNDIIYTREGYTTLNKLIMLSDIKEHEVYEDEFFGFLNYPYKMLSRIDAEEDYEPEDFSMIATPQIVTIPLTVEIPSPFVKLAFLP